MLENLLFSPFDKCILCFNFHVIWDILSVTVPLTARVLYQEETVWLSFWRLTAVFNLTEIIFHQNMYRWPCNLLMHWHFTNIKKNYVVMS